MVDVGSPFNIEAEPVKVVAASATTPSTSEPTIIAQVEPTAVEQTVQGQTDADGKNPIANVIVFSVIIAGMLFFAYRKKTASNTN